MNSKEREAARVRRAITTRLAVTRDMGMDDEAQAQSAMRFVMQVCPQLSEHEAGELVRAVMGGIMPLRA